MREGTVNKGRGRRLYDWLENRLTALLAPACRLCGAPASAPPGLCRACHHALPWLVPGCPACAVPGPPGRLCGDCLKRPPAFDVAVAAFRYEGEVAGLVRRFKLSGDLDAGRVLADRLSVTAQGLPESLVPMPLHPQRRRERGFNQASEIARRLPGRVRHGLVERVRGTTPQRGLHLRERRRNVRGAFVTTGAPVPERVTLVDDVITTAATVNELARCLRAAGAREIAVCALARAGR